MYDLYWNQGSVSVPKDIRNDLFGFIFCIKLFSATLYTPWSITSEACMTKQFQHTRDVFVLSSFINPNSHGHTTHPGFSKVSMSAKEKEEKTKNCQLCECLN